MKNSEPITKKELREFTEDIINDLKETFDKLNKKFDEILKKLETKVV